jgi:hypothetical protein
MNYKSGILPSCPIVIETQSVLLEEMAPTTEIWDV